MGHKRENKGYIKNELFNHEFYSGIEIKINNNYL